MWSLGAILNPGFFHGQTSFDVFRLMSLKTIDCFLFWGGDVLGGRIELLAWVTVGIGCFERSSYHFCSEDP